MSIHWRPILFIGLVWLFIVDGPAACDILHAVRVSHNVCNYRVIASCEP